MGNQASSQQDARYGGIFVKLDQEVFAPGDTLSGNIYVDLRAPYPGDKLCLEIKGNETTKWIDKEARQRPKPGGPEGMMETYYVDVPRDGKFKIIENDLCVYDWNARQVIPPGQYTFPFSFQIPNGLPGSFFFQRGQDCVAEIKYSVEGYLKPEVESVPKLKHKLNITMREKIQQNIETKELTLSKEISTWCCISQGKINLRTAFEKDAYAPGEEARMLTEIDNSKCSLNIDNVIFSLNQSISLRADNSSKGFHFPVKTVDLGSIAPGTSCLGDQRKQASLVLPPGQEGRAKDFGTANGAGTFGFQNGGAGDAGTITPSTHGRLIQSNFSLSLSCSVEGCICCDSVPSVSIPIQVYSAIKVRQPDPTPPSGWNPTPMPQANLTITIVQLANGGQEIHIDTGSQGANPGMMGNQMPPQQAGFGQPNQQAQMQQAKPMMDNSMSSPHQLNTSQQPLVNNNNGYQQQQPMNNQPINNGFQNQNQYNQQQQPQTINPQPVQIGQNNNGFQNQNQYNQQQQPQTINPQPVQIGQNNNGQFQNQNQYNQPQQPMNNQPMNNGQFQNQNQYNQQQQPMNNQPMNNGQFQNQNQYNQPQQPMNNGFQNQNQYNQPMNNGQY